MRCCYPSVLPNAVVRKCLVGVLSLAWTATALSAAEPASGKQATPAKQEAAGVFEVQIVRDLAYRDLYEGEDAKKGKNKLDLYLPRGQKDFPVLLFVHGGAWVHGDKNFLGIYSNFATFWAKRGIGTVVINYRLSPGVKHPEHIKDVARAFAWTHKNIQKYGGRPDEIFVCGHSAGGHLISLLATDETYLKAEGLNLHDIKGAIPISGVYRVHDLNVYAGVVMTQGDHVAASAGAKMRKPPFAFVFGADPKALKDASPLTHVKASLPPFLIIYAERDLLTLPEMAKEFAKALEEKHCEVQALEVRKRRHMSLLLNSTLDGDPVAKAMTEFIAKHTEKK